MFGQLQALTVREHIARMEVIREAAGWIPTPFMHGARIKGVGAECGSFVAEVFGRCGIANGYKLPSHKVQWHLHKDSPDFDPDFFVREISRFSVEITGHPLPGDVALFWWGHAYSHSAIVIDWPTKLIHCSVRGGVQYADATLDPFLKRHARQHPPRFFSAWR